MRLWDVTAPASPHPLGSPLTGHTSGVYAVVFSPDGRTLATASGDGTVRLWDVTAPASPHPLGAPLISHTAGHTGPVRAVVFSPDGRTLATASADHTAQLWDITPLQAVRADPVRAACALARSSLDPESWNRDLPGIPYVPTCSTQN